MAIASAVGNQGWRRFGRSTGLGVVLLIVLAISVYLPVRRAGFIWDDDDHLTANPAMTTPHGLGLIWSSLAVSRYYPLTLTSFWLQYHGWGLRPWPYHAVNVLLHAANAALIFLLLRRLRVPGAFVAAAVWAVHPVNVESVAWVTELKNTQSTFFFLLAVLGWLGFEEQPGPGRYAVLLACGSAALLSKPSTVMLPVVLLLVSWWQHGDWRRANLRRLAPLIALAIGMAGLAIVEQQTQIAGGESVNHLSLLDRGLLAARAGWFYLGKLCWPVNLMFIYPRWPIHAGTLRDWVPVLAALGVGAGLWCGRRQHWVPGVWLGLGYFLVALLPVLGFFDVYFFRYSYVADHFQYLASLGPVALVTAGGAVGVRWRWLRVALAAAGLLLLSGLTWQYTHAFQNATALWQDVVAKNPDAWLAHNGLGSILAATGDKAGAADHFAAALRLKPDFVEAHNNLGNLLARQGKLAAAAEEFTAALRINPSFPGAHYNLGNVRALQKDFPAAIAEYEAALRYRPDFAAARVNLELARKLLAATP